MKEICGKNLGKFDQNLKRWEEFVENMREKYKTFQKTEKFEKILKKFEIKVLRKSTTFV